MDTHRRTAPNRDAQPAEQRSAALTLTDAAAALGLSIHQLRRRMTQSGVKGTMSTAAHGGRLVLLQPADLDVLRGTVPNSERVAQNGADARETALSPAVAVEGWTEALTEARAHIEAAERRTDAAEARADKLAARVAEVERRADVLETQLRRSRDESDRWRAQAEGLRTAWHTWRRALDGSSWWRLARRKLPAEPPEFTSGPAISVISASVE